MPTIRDLWTRIAPVPPAGATAAPIFTTVFRAGEIISSMLLTWHNLYYYQDLMAGMREAIAQDRFAEFEAAFHAARSEGDIPPP